MLKEGGGGRVTELVARPLVNLFFPELSGFIQPLAGEYAGRRSLLEQFPFFTGYAVEIGHLIDAAERAGIEGLGQVDLERRVHRNQELEGLSRMSFVILQAVMKRLEERRRVRLFAELGSTMKLPRSGRGPPLARGPRARRPRAAADDPDPRVPREAARGRGRPHRLTMADRQLRVLIAPDSFKGSLTSVEVARALADGWHRARPSDDLHLAPLADGGEGTLSRSRPPAAGSGGRPTRTTRSGARSAPAGSGARTAAPPSSRWPRRPGLSLVAAARARRGARDQRGHRRPAAGRARRGDPRHRARASAAARPPTAAPASCAPWAPRSATTWRRSTSTASTRACRRRGSGSRAT